MLLLKLKEKEGVTKTMMTILMKQEGVACPIWREYHVLAVIEKLQKAKKAQVGELGEALQPPFDTDHPYEYSIVVDHKEYTAKSGWKEWNCLTLRKITG